MTTTKPNKIGARLTKLNLNVQMGLCLAALSLVFIFYLVPTQIEEAPRLQNPMMSPLWLPSVMGWIVFILSLALCLSELLTKDSKTVAHVGEKRSTSILVLTVVAVGYIMLFEVVGAGLTAIAGTWILFAIRGVRSPLLYLFGILMPISVYFFFSGILNVPLPSGIL